MAVRTFVLPQGLVRAVWPAKLADETVDFSVDWSARLAAGDAIASSTFALPSGLISPKSENSDKVATVWISGGEAGQAYGVVNRVTTRTGTVLEQTILLRVKTR
ncbi:phage fiber-tail adaptor protein [Bradyrhizobium sp. 215_C5_N1_1]|uniref:phage fiber-tail adaptor protein n=1 Tax=unclassified Bradyrhizobium TaxID=2631580 RepID=UPI003F8CA35E